MTELERIFKESDKRLMTKYTHYFEIYERHFNRYRNQEIIILEIGVSHGGSLQMWKDYFGQKAKIYGIDIEPRCKEFEEDNIHILIGSQSDRKFLEQVKKEIPPIDILIDDGGHMMKQQIVSFEVLFNHIKDNGVYLCEDLHTSYWISYGGGYKRRGTFIEYSKNFIDYINAYHSRQKKLKINYITQTVSSLHYYDSVLVIEKRKKEKPYAITAGNDSFHDPETNHSFSEKTVLRVKKIINIVMRFLRLRNIF